MQAETVAILVDGGFFQYRAKHLWGSATAQERADQLEKYCSAHLRHNLDHRTEYDRLYRIFYYDCPPASENVFHPLLQKDIFLKKTELYSYMTKFHDALRCKRKVALRLGKLSSDIHYVLTLDAQKKLRRGTITVDQLTEKDFTLDVGQKGVDMRIGLDISSMAFKKQVTRMILISGDSDFVPAAKQARREGIDFLLDPMGANITADLSEHIDGLQTRWRSIQKKDDSNNVKESPLK